jgi:hypothetical protein
VPRSPRPVGTGARRRSRDGADPIDSEDTDDRALRQDALDRAIELRTLPPLAERRRGRFDLAPEREPGGAVPARLGVRLELLPGAGVIPEESRARSGRRRRDS